MKLCKNCKYYQGAFVKVECIHPKNAENKIDLVTGEKTTVAKWKYAATLRYGSRMESWMARTCGIAGRWFELKEVV